MLTPILPPPPSTPSLYLPAAPDFVDAEIPVETMCVWGGVDEFSAALFDEEGMQPRDARGEGEG